MLYELDRSTQLQTNFMSMLKHQQAATIQPGLTFQAKVLCRKFELVHANTLRGAFARNVESVCIV
jgi:hypothetical protein